ncbi:MAG TPA: hypothetical protein VK886_14365 [Vicinamibacterales bacterium]|nr:hypothetical protein [Vicinamibacterales bacterium]
MSAASPHVYAVLAFSSAAVFLLVPYALRKRAPLMALIIACGILIRVLAGASLFWISYLRLPVLRDIQAGEGFWLILPDARTYYDLASTVASTGVLADSALPSPTFINALAGCIAVFGATPAAGVFLNVAAYATTAGLLAVTSLKAWNRETRCFREVMLAAYSFSPALVVFGAQVLKDALFAALIVAASVAGAHLSGAAADAAGRRRLRTLFRASTLVALMIVVHAMAGVRAYFPVLVIAAMFVAWLVALREIPQRLRFGGLVAIAAATCVLWIAARSGAVDYYRVYETQMFGSPLSGPFAVLDNARASFRASGGATNIVDSGGEQAGDIGALLTHPVRSLSRLGVGLVVVFAPISTLTSLSLVTFPGGRGLLWLTDLDTLFLDVSAGVLIWLLWRRRRAVGWHGPSACFALVVSTLSVVLIAYTVTNYGTLFRLRVMIAVPLWLVALAVRDREAPAAAPQVAAADSSDLTG